MHLINKENMNRSTILAITGGILLTWLMSSCLDNEVILNAYGDAYILVEMNGQDTVKGIGFHAFSYYEFKTVEVTVTGNPALKYNLASYMNYKQDFIWSTPSDQFSKILPQTGEYVFKATFTDDQTLDFYDRLTSDYILPPVIKSCTYNLQTKEAEVEWEKVKLADAYNVKVMDQTGKLLFVSPTFSNSTTYYAFDTSTKGWQTSVTLPSGGQKVWVEVNSYLVEDMQDQNELQCISRTRKEISWGQ